MTTSQPWQCPVVDMATADASRYHDIECITDDNVVVDCDTHSLVGVLQ